MTSKGEWAALIVIIVLMVAVSVVLGYAKTVLETGGMPWPQ